MAHANCSFLPIRSQTLLAQSTRNAIPGISPSNPHKIPRISQVTAQAGALLSGHYCVMTLRCIRERIYQTLAYELGGLVLATPLYSIAFGASQHNSLLLTAALSLAVMIWSPIHNTVFDWAEFRLTRRLASDRPHGLRLVHAAMHEATAVIATLPLIMWLGGHGLWTALCIDIGLTLLYTGYAYVFHILYDWLRPVRQSEQQQSTAH
jgi:uncharacterized membrane protein